MLYGSDGPADKAAELPYELQALEVALSAVCKALDLETNEVEARICPALDNLAQKVYKRDLDDVRNLKSRLNRVCARAVKVKQVVLPTNCTYAVSQVLASTPNCLELGVRTVNILPTGDLMRTKLVSNALQSPGLMYMFEWCTFFISPGSIRYCLAHQ